MAETIYYGGRNLDSVGNVSFQTGLVTGSTGATSLYVVNNIYATNTITTGNLITQNIVMSSNMTSGTGFGNVYFSGNLVVSGNIFSSGGSVGSGSGTSQGYLLTLGSNYSLPAAFATGSVGSSVSAHHINLSLFSPEAAQAVTVLSTSSGLIKFTTAGLYQLTCVLVGDQPVTKVAIGKSAAYTSYAALSAVTTFTSGYDYVYNYPVGASPTTVITLPITVTDVSQYYYLDVFFSTAAGTPSVLYPTRSTTAVGSNFGTYIQISPYGNYLSSATGVASALLANCVNSSNLSGVYSSNAYRLALTTANGWTVNGTSTSLAVTANGNFQVNQAGIYEVNLCLNTVGNTPAQFQVGSLLDDTKAPGGTTPLYLYTYAPMYTQDPTTVVSLPLNITNISNVYFVECSFPGVLTGNVALSQTSTFVSIKPIGGYINTGTNPWTQQGTSVYYNGGNVGLGVIPTALTETFTVSGNTSFVGNVTQVTDASGSSYVTAKRVPAGSLGVQNYVTGSVPLTTTTNLIQNYLSNAATVSTAGVGGYGPALSTPGTNNSFVNLGPYVSSHATLASTNVFFEAWIYPNAVSGIYVNLLETANTTAEDFGIVLNNGTLYGVVSNTTGGSTTSSGGASFSTGSWQHAAVSWNAVTKVFYSFKNGTATAAGPALTGTPRFTADQSITIGGSLIQPTVYSFNGYIYDMRIIRGSTVPTTSFTAPATPSVFSSTTLPNYTGLSALSGNVIALALQSQYFPGASTSPYGPCLTLPGTVGSYYSQSAGTNLDWKGTGGFTLEAWVNYASLANANTFAFASAVPSSIISGFPTSPAETWMFGATTTGALAFAWYTAAGNQANSFITSNTLTTGTWNHVLVQSNASNVYMAINGNFTTLTAQGFTPTAGNTTIAPTIAPSTSYPPSTNPVTVGQFNSATGPNFAVAKARLVYGANVYSSGSFVPSPNFAPSSVAPFWQLESQYPLPTYPSIQDVTQLPQQAASYGSLPTVIGGVTSNVIGPLPLYPTLDSLRFDGTGYIDYGNAASSVLNSNLWANAWTIEGWLYLNSLPTAATYPALITRLNPGVTEDWGLHINPSGQLYFQTGASTFSTQTSTVAPGSWIHVAATWDLAKINVYSSVQTTPSSVSLTAGDATFTPVSSVRIGASASNYIIGNLADVRVSNVARYTTSYSAPSQPFTNDANTLLLLKTLAGQPGTTLEVQGRGLNATSIGAGRTVNAYPPAPMSSYLLDTTGNTAVTYGQGKYVVSTSSELQGYGGNYAYYAFDKSTSTGYAPAGFNYNAVYSGSVTTVDVLGNSYSGDWLQIQMPVSVLLSSYSITPGNASQVPVRWWVLGSRDGINWTLVDSRNTTVLTSGTIQSFSVSASQACNFYRITANQVAGGGTWLVAEWTLNGTEESLCVTNDSKVGVGIANPQRALEVAGDLVVGGTISGGAGMGMFRNRIINGDMRIAQRGASSSALTTYGCVDRFVLYYSITTGVIAQAQQNLTASDAPYQLGIKNSLRYTVTTACTNFSFIVPGQIIEGYNMADFNWGTSFGSPITISFWLRTNLNAGSVLAVCLRDQGYTNTYNTPVTTIGVGAWQYVTTTVPPPPNGTTWNTGSSGAIEMYIGAYYGAGLSSNPGVWELNANKNGLTASTNWPAIYGAYIEFTGVQLEKGTVATPFEFRPYATELALCQRYCQVVKALGTSSFPVIGNGHATASNVFDCAVTLPVVMRTTPTIITNLGSAVPGGAVITLGNSTGTDPLYMYNGSNYSFNTATITNYLNPNTFLLRLTNNSTGTFTNGLGGTVYSTAQTYNYVIYSAEL